MDQMPLDDVLPKLEKVSDKEERDESIFDANVFIVI